MDRCAACTHANSSSRSAATDRHLICLASPPARRRWPQRCCGHSVWLAAAERRRVVQATPCWPEGREFRAVPRGGRLLGRHGVHLQLLFPHKPARQLLCKARQAEAEGHVLRNLFFLSRARPTTSCLATWSRTSPCPPPCPPLAPVLRLFSCKMLSWLPGVYPFPFVVLSSLGLASLSGSSTACLCLAHLAPCRARSRRSHRWLSCAPLAALRRGRIGRRCRSFEQCEGLGMSSTPRVRRGNLRRLQVFSLPSPGRTSRLRRQQAQAKAADLLRCPTQAPRRGARRWVARTSRSRAARKRGRHCTASTGTALSSPNVPTIWSHVVGAATLPADSADLRTTRFELS